MKRRLLIFLLFTPLLKAQTIAASYVNSGSGWAAWNANAGFGSLSYVPGTTIYMYCQASAGAAWQPCNPSGGGGGSGTVTSVSVTTANGVSGTVATATTTPAISLTLGAITPTSTNGVSAATMAFMDATSSVQTQLNAKAPTASPTFSGTVTISSTINQPFIVNSSNANGSGLLIEGSAAGTDTWVIGSISTAGGGSNALGIGDFTSGLYSMFQTVNSSGAGLISVPDLMTECWVSGISVTTTPCDTGLSRDAAGVLDVGNGTQGNKSGTIQAAKILGLTTPLSAAQGGTGNGSLTFPAGTATVPQTVGSGTAAMGTSAIASGACATVVTVATSGVATTDVITVGFNGDPTAVTGYGASATGAVLSIYPYPSSGNANFKVCNSSSASITPSALTLNFRVVR